MQLSEEDRIMAGQNDAERKIRGQSLMILSGHDSVVSGCGFAALRSLRLRRYSGVSPVPPDQLIGFDLNRRPR